MEIRLLLEEIIKETKFMTFYKKVIKIKIVKNPNSKEFSQLFDEEGIVRGVILPDGDIYCIKKIVHTDLIAALYQNKIISDESWNWWRDASSLGKFLCVESFNGSSWNISESYQKEVLESRIFTRYFTEYKKAMSKRFKVLKI